AHAERRIRVTKRHVHGAEPRGDVIPAQVSLCRTKQTWIRQQEARSEVLLREIRAEVIVANGAEQRELVTGPLVLREDAEGVLVRLARVVDRALGDLVRHAVVQPNADRIEL